MRLIVNADDFGLSRGVNLGIIEAHKNGIVTSTTLMVTMNEVEHALELAKLIKGMNCIVNLINLNEVKENNLKRCDEQTQKTFAETLKSKGINVTTRRSLGNDIDGACGQLRRRYIKENK